MSDITYNITPSQLVDEVSVNQFYIGVSSNGNNITTPFWQIKMISKNSNVWSTAYPDGDQSFSYVWDNRADYDYL